MKSKTVYLSVFIFALLAHAANFSPSAPLKNKVIGVFCLPSGQAGAGTPSKYTLQDMIADSCWTNSNLTGFSLRTFWELVETADGVYDWAFFDQAVLQARKNRKLLAIDVTAGEFTPDWVYAAGAHKISYTKTNGAGHQKTITAVLPWDPIFLKKWLTFISAFGERYDGVPEVAYVTTGGLGRQCETIYADTPDSIALFNKLAPGGNGDAAWIEAGKKILDAYFKGFPTTPFINASSPPTTDPAGKQAQMTLLSWASANYGPHFGLKSCALTATSYSLNAMPAQEIAALTAAGAPAGYQMFLPQAHMRGTLKDTLANGIQLKGQFLEVYKSDCVDAQASVLNAANAQLLKSYAK